MKIIEKIEELKYTIKGNRGVAEGLNYRLNEHLEGTNYGQGHYSVSERSNMRKNIDEIIEENKELKNKLEELEQEVKNKGELLNDTKVAIIANLKQYKSSLEGTLSDLNNGVEEIKNDYEMETDQREAWLSEIEEWTNSLNSSIDSLETYIKGFENDELKPYFNNEEGEYVNFQILEEYINKDYEKDYDSLVKDASKVIEQLYDLRINGEGYNPDYKYEEEEEYEE